MGLTRDITWKLSTAEIQAAMRRLQGSGYADGSTSTRDLLLLCWAAMLADADDTVVSAFLESFVSQTTEELETWEHTYGLTNDAARTVAQRRSRLELIERAVSTHSPTDLDDLIRALLGNESFTLLNASDGVSDSGSAEETAFRRALRISTTAWADPATRETARAIMRRVTPVRYLGEHGLPVASHMVVRNHMLTWGGQTGYFDADYLGTVGSTENNRTIHARVREFGAYSIVRARDMNRIQAEGLWSFIQSATTHTYSMVGVGQAVRYVSGSATNGQTVTLDSSVDWRDRYILLSLATSTTDRRPGGANETSWGNATSGLTMSFRLVDGGAGNVIETNITVDVNQSSGVLRLTNNTGGTIYFCGFVEGLPPFYEGRIASETLRTFYDGQKAASMNKAWADRMFDCRLKAGSGVTVPVDADTTRTFSWAATVTITATRYYIVLDDVLDWRDRVLRVNARLISGYTSPNTTPRASVYPGHNAQGSGYNGNSIVWTDSGEYTGSATTSSNVALLTYDEDVQQLSGVDFLLYARVSTGDLILEVIPTGSETAPFSTYGITINVLATGRFGLHTTTPTAYSTYVGSGYQLEVEQINRMQDLLLARQTQSVYYETCAVPFGEFAVLQPRYVTKPRTRDGRDRNQMWSGGLRRAFTAYVAAATSVVIDTTHDWRDRIATSYGIASTSAIHRDGASRSSLSSATTKCSSAYLSKEDLLGESNALDVGTPGNSNCVLFARESDGALMLRNRSSSNAYVLAAIDASPQLGYVPRGGGPRPTYQATIPGATSMMADADLIAWWDASEGPMCSYSTNVKGWIDRSFSGSDGGLVGATQPVYSATSFDSSPGVTFAGTGTDIIACDPTSLLSSATGLTVVMFLQDSTTADSSPFALALANAWAAGRVWVEVNHPSHGVGTIRLAVGRSGTSYEIWQATASLASPTCLSFGIQAADTTSPIEGIRVNGSPTGARSSITGSNIAVDFSTATKLAIGGVYDGAGGWSGTIAQVAVFRRLLTGAEVAKVEAQMKGSRYSSITLGGSTSWT